MCPGVCRDGHGLNSTAFAKTFLFLALVTMLWSCGEDPMPRPRGYFRIDLPEQKQVPYAGACPFTAEVPAYAIMARRPGDTLTHADTACWVNMRFPQQRATVHMTYRRVSGDLGELIRDAHAFKDRHEAKAVKIRSERVLHDSTHVFGTLFDVEGDVASPLVFYVTDSTTHFLYGSLYFDARPNADSLAPVTDRIRSDVRGFVNSLRWR
ncbi:MAG TPA: hypothetical protein VHL57_00100 [Flavobacteriales bacterium]|jgi:gliding motility-associated lipoprotein GldD|nr:hypothetical protein [Flavobacteriales bacterium]